jgi:diphthine synthase
MTVAQCAEQMLQTESSRNEGVYGPDSLAVGVARIGADDQKLVAGTLRQLCETDLGPPLHSLVLLGRRTHDLEREFIADFAADLQVFNEVWMRDYEGKQAT